MKRILFTIILSAFLCSNLHAQKLGYKEFQIGKSLNSADFEWYEMIKFKNESDTNFYLIYLDSTMVFCDVPLVSIILQTDTSKIIDNLTIFTTNNYYKDFTTYFNKFMEVINCTVSVFGKADAVNFENKEHKFIVVWELKDVGNFLRIEGESMGTFAKNEKRSISITWSRKKKTKLW